MMECGATTEKNIRDESYGLVPARIIYIPALVLSLNTAVNPTIAQSLVTFQRCQIMGTG